MRLRLLLLAFFLAPFVTAPPAAACGAGGLPPQTSADCGDVLFVCTNGLLAIEVVGWEVGLDIEPWTFTASWMEPDGLRTVTAASPGPTFEYHLLRTDAVILGDWEYNLTHGNGWHYSRGSCLSSPV